MTWIIPAFIAVLAWTTTNIFDKFIIDKENRDQILLTVVWGITYLIIFSTIASIKGEIWAGYKVALICFLAGVCYSIAGWLYFRVVNKEDISITIPYFQTSKLIVVLMAFFLLGEKFDAITYVGLALILGGALALSVRKIKHHLKFDWVILLALVGAFFFATRNILLKIVSDTSVWPVYFWLGIGMGTISLIMLVFHHPHLKKKAKKGIKHMVLVTVISSIALLSYIYALSQGPITLVTGIMGTQPLFILIAATTISKFRPKFIKEHSGHGQLLKKIISVIAIIIGTLLIL